LVGIANRDVSYDRLVASLTPFSNVDFDRVVFDDSRCTITKTRIMGHHQQIVRVDSEDTSAISFAIEEAIIEAAKDA
ncbi:hypothetical protein MKW35_17810, partial [Aestuariibaculum sp. L182]|nr:hypothetical protein [Aestuariibaculum lutulentum]